MKSCPLCHQTYPQDVKMCSCGYDFITAKNREAIELSYYKPLFFIYGTLFNGVVSMFSYFFAKEMFLVIFLPFVQSHQTNAVLPLFGGEIPPPPGFGLILLYFIPLFIIGLIITFINKGIYKRIHRDQKNRYMFLQIGIAVLLICGSIFADVYWL